MAKKVKETKDKKVKETNTKKETKEVVFYTQELKQRTIDNEEYTKVKAFIIILVIILVCLGLLALVNGNFVTKDYKEKEETTTTTTVQYDDSLLTVDRMFSIKDHALVLLYDTKNSTENDFATEMAGKYSDDSVKLYKVDMASSMNKAYYDEAGKENTAPTSKEELVITKTTLIEMKKGKVVKYITDKAEIANKLNTKKDE